MIVGRYRGCSLSLSLSCSCSLIVVNFLRLGGNPRFVEASRGYILARVLSLPDSRGFLYFNHRINQRS